MLAAQLQATEEGVLAGPLRALSPTGMGKDLKYASSAQVYSQKAACLLLSLLLGIQKHPCATRSQGQEGLLALHSQGFRLILYIHTQLIGTQVSGETACSSNIATETQ